MTVNEWMQGFIVGLGVDVLILLFIMWDIARRERRDEKYEEGVQKVRQYIPKSEKYYLSSYRYLELKAFCRQYAQWHEDLRSCYGFKANSFGQTNIRGSEHSDPTERAVELAEKYKTKIDMVDKAANLADPTLARYIILNATQGLSFEAMERIGKRPPCGINQFYEARQKFFWELDRLKE